MKKGRGREGRRFSGNVYLHGVVGKARYARRVVAVAMTKAKADAVFRLSETVKVQFLFELHGFVRSHVCCRRARKRTAMSANLRLAFTMERCLSRKSCGAAGKGIPMPIASLCFGGTRFCGSPCCRAVLTIERGKRGGDGDERRVSAHGEGGQTHREGGTG